MAKFLMIGLALGMMIGVIIDNVALGPLIGVTLGFLLNLASKRRQA